MNFSTGIFHQENWLPNFPVVSEYMVFTALQHIIYMMENFHLKGISFGQFGNGHLQHIYDTKIDV